MQKEKEDEIPADANAAKAEESGDESEVSAALDELKKEVGELRKALAARPVADIDAAAGRRAEPKLTKEALAKMSQAEVARLDWNEVRRVLSAG